MRKAFSGAGSFITTPFGVVFITAILWHAVVFAFGIPINWLFSSILLILDCALAYFLLNGLTYFFSQFILPIQKEEDRKEIYSRVLKFASGKRGPILFIKNGRVILHEDEQNKRGAGVLVLDSASAVVLRTDTNIVGAVGPGVRFTKANEYLISHTVDEKTEPIGVDLRTQWQFIGPLANDQPLLNPIDNTNNNKVAIEIEKRRQQTVGVTRDGFEVSPTISIKFSIRRIKEVRPNEHGVKSQFRYDATAVRDAITKEAIQLDKKEDKKTRLEWKQLPAQLVINLWREYVRTVKLEELFTTSTSMSGIRHIEEMIKQRVYKPKVIRLNEISRPDASLKKDDSLEYQQLEEHGLEISEVRIHNVMFDKSIEEERIQQWNTEWKKIAERELALLAEKQALMETTARNEAFKRFTRAASQKFENPSALPQNLYATLQKLIEPVRESLVTENRANESVENELRNIDEILKWLIVNKQDYNRRNTGNDL